MTKIIFQVIANLENGKQLVRFLDGTQEELWPFDILPIHFMEEASSDADGDDDRSMLESNSSKDSTLFSVTLDDIQIELCRYGLSHWQMSSERNIVDPKDLERVTNKLLETYPLLDVLSSEYSPENGVDRKAEILFSGLMLDASGRECGESSKSLVRFAYVMTAVYRSRRLPDNFDIHLLSEMLDGYKNGSVTFENFHPTKTSAELIFCLEE
ncbi:hypothetical protein DICVIV_07668, partial [Dictyocaulus viviparus]